MKRKQAITPMTLDEYNTALERLNKIHQEHIQKLQIQFARENNTVQIGQIVTDHIGSVLVEKLGFYLSMRQPSMRYWGVELNKDGTPNKRGNKRWAYQTNLIKK